MNPLVSIIIPFYGTADRKLLDRCTASIRQQGMSPSDYEIIVSDDEGRGLGSARNLGVQKAKGDYILFIDADDYYFAHSLDSLISLIRNRTPDMLSFGVKKIRSGSTYNPSGEEHIQMFEQGAAFMKAHNFLGASTRHFYRRAWFNDHHLTFPEMSYHEDEALVCKAYFWAGLTIITDKEVYAYVQQEQSILHSQDAERRHKRIEGFRNILYDLKAFQKKHISASHLQQEALQRRISFLTIDFFIQLIRNRSSYRQWRSIIKDLKASHLLPLPTHHYSSKYNIARFFINLLTSL